MNTGVYISFQTIVFSRYIPRSGIAGSYGSSVFSFWRNLQTGLHTGCSTLYPHQKYGRVPFPPHPLQHILFVGFFDDGHSAWCEVISYYSFDLCFSNNDVEHLFKCLLATCISSLKKYLFRSFAHFFDCVVCLFDIELHELFLNFETNPLLVT